MPDWLIPTVSIAGVIVSMWVALGKRTGRVETRLGERIGRVETRLTNTLYQLLGRSPVSQKSPLQLNDLGETVSSEIRARDWADRVLGSLSEWAEGKDSYEIQERCFEFAERFEYTAEEQRLIQRSAYNHGLPTQQVHRVLAIELRNRLLKMASKDPPT